jgi:hypothetical protein
VNLSLGACWQGHHRVPFHSYHQDQLGLSWRALSAFASGLSLLARLDQAGQLCQLHSVHQDRAAKRKVLHERLQYPLLRLQHLWRQLQYLLRRPQLLLPAQQMLDNQHVLQTEHQTCQNSLKLDKVFKLGIVSNGF